MTPASPAIRLGANYSSCQIMSNGSLRHSGSQGLKPRNYSGIRVLQTFSQLVTSGDIGLAVVLVFLWLCPSMTRL